jgi:hypothetical protein
MRNDGFHCVYCSDDPAEARESEYLQVGPNIGIDWHFCNFGKWSKMKTHNLWVWRKYLSTFSCCRLEQMGLRLWAENCKLATEESIVFNWLMSCIATSWYFLTGRWSLHSENGGGVLVEAAAAKSQLNICGCCYLLFLTTIKLNHWSSVNRFSCPIL